MERVARHYAPAALAIAVAAWRQGTDIAQAVQQAGYAWDVAQGLAEYVQSRYFREEEVPPLTTTTQSQQEDVPMSAQVKRARVSAGAPRVAPSVRKYVKKCMERTLERKYRTKAHSGVSPGTGGTFYSVGIPDITQGTGDDNRVGNEVRILKVTLNGLVYDSAAAAGNCRILLIEDHQYNGGNPNVTDILQSSATYTNYNHNNVIGYGGARFKILADKFYTTDWDIAATPTFKKIAFMARPKCIINYGASTGASTDVIAKNVYVLALGFSGTTTFTINCDVEFVDE